MNCPDCNGIRTRVKRTVPIGRIITRMSGCVDCGVTWRSTESIDHIERSPAAARVHPQPPAAANSETAPQSLTLPLTLTLKSSQKSGSDARKSNNDANYSQDFLEFWGMYPNKSGKGTAWVSWQNLTPSISAVRDALAWQSKSKDWVKDGGKYVPMPATYLNNRRWEDEPRKAPDPWANSMYPELGK